MAVLKATDAQAERKKSGATVFPVANKQRIDRKRKRGSKLSTGRHSERGKTAGKRGRCGQRQTSQCARDHASLVNSEPCIRIKKKGFEGGGKST